MATITLGNSYRFKDYNNNKYLNILVNGNPANNSNVTIYSLDSSDMAQVWQCVQYSALGVSGALMKSVKDPTFALDNYRGSSNPNNADVYKIGTTAADLKDQLVEFILLTNGYYRIKLAYYDLYLTVTTESTYGGFNVRWQALTGNTNQLWAAELYGSSTITTTAPSAIVDKTFYVKNFNTGYNLNVYGTDTVANERNVNVYSKEKCLAQKWIVRQKSDGAKLFTTINETYALNINTNTNNCSMYTESSNSSADSVLEFVPYTDATITSADKVYKIKMANHNKYLDVESVGSGANAYWVNSPAYPLWQFVSESDMFPTPKACPTAIKDSTFAIQANGTDFYLNVHGTDTVADGRNVNIYSKDDALAQRWIPKQTTEGPKLFTKINEDFALNIHTVDNNCTMYTSSGNDEDSVLEFESVGTMQYKIKMFNHNKYLAIDGTADSGSNVVWVDGSANATVWKFIPETTAFPTPNPAPSTIVDKPFFIRNFNTKYNLNVHGTNTVANGRNVNVFAKEPEDAQRWRVLNTAKGPKIVTEINNSFALNIHVENNNNCTMYNIDASNTDTVLELIPYTDAAITSADKVYRIKMFHHNRYLDADGTGSGYNVRWSESPNGYTLWQFVEEDDMFPPVEDAPADIADKVFFIQNVNTGHFLNVHGNDTVANTRNVNVYSKEDVDAQRWVIENRDGGPKLITEVDDSFAVNIYTNDNNCTMYKEDGNDIDSVLQFIPYTTGQTAAEDGVYRIKMHYHNRYLTVSNTNIGANAWWTSVDTEPYALWRLIPESEMTFETVTPTGADSPLVTKFIPADTSNYTACPDGRTISAITIHHTAGNISIDTLGAMWQNPDRNASSHYGVRGTQVGQFVNERDIAWTNGHDSNAWCVTIETCNSTSAPNWEVSDDTYYTLVRLVADIAKRNNLGTLVVGENLTYHSFYSATECPGPYLLSKMQDIADRANKINNVTYIRKHNTRLYLGVNSNNEIIWTDRDGAKGWNKVESDGEYTFYDIDDDSMCLQVADDGVTPILASKDTIVFRVVGIENERGLINLGVVNSITTYGIFDIVKNWISGILPTLGVAKPGVIEDTPDEFTDSEEDMEYSPEVSSEFLDKNVRIKYKSPTSDTYYYLSIVENKELHPSGNGVKISFATFDEYDVKQIWKIKHYGGGLCGLLSCAFSKISAEIDPYSNAVIANDRSILESLTFDGSEIDEQYDKMLRNLGISIIPVVDSEKEEYLIKFSAYDKYLGLYATSSYASAARSNNNYLNFEFEIISEALSPVNDVNDVDILGRYTGPLNIDGIVQIKNIPDRLNGGKESSTDILACGGFADETDFEKPTAWNMDLKKTGAVKDALIKYTNKVFKTDVNNIIISDADRLYYLYGEYYGKYKDENGEEKNGWYHSGVDVVATKANGSTDVDVYALYGGKVISIENPNTGNGAVGIYNEFLDVTFFYLHMITDENLLEKFNAEKDTVDGCLIEPGTRIGTQSDVGKYAQGSTHLHFEVRIPRNSNDDTYNRYADLIYSTTGENIPTILPYGYMNGIF